MEKLRLIFKAKQVGRVVASQSLSTLANRMIGFVIPWLVLERTGSALNAGSVAFFMGIATLIGSLISGLISDRIGGRKASIISDVFSLITVLILPLSLLFDFLPIWLIVITQVLGVLFDGAGAIGKDTLVPRAAKDDKVPLVKATSLQETLQGTANFVGPLAAGLLIDIFSESITLVIVSLLFFICILLISGVRRQAMAHSEKLTFKKGLADIREGFSFVWKEPLLRPITLFLIISSAYYFPLVAVIFPAWFVLDGQSSSLLGTFLGAQALGTIVGGGLFTLIAAKVSAYKWFILANCMVALTFAGYLFVQPGSVISILLSFVNGLASAGLMPIVFTAYYARTPQHLMGRVNGAAGTIMYAAIPLAYLGSGWLISASSVHTALIAALGCVILLAVLAIFTPAFKLFDENKNFDEQSPAEAPELAKKDE
ncbi:MAG TPA: MFS transporter [Candidatus Saccharimonadales bacterium]|nr:MFS transporter [Candidatus Saccharimonadales bacterium]